MSERQKNLSVNPTLDAVQTAPNVPRQSKQGPKSQPMQGAPKWARVAAYDEGMMSVLEAAFGATEVPEAEMQAGLARMRQIMGSIAANLPPVDTTSPHNMKHGYDIVLPPRHDQDALEPVTNEVYELAALPGEHTTDPLDARIKQLLAEDVGAFNKDAADFDSVALLTRVYKTMGTIGLRQEADCLPPDNIEPEVSNLDSTVVLTRALDKISEAQLHNNELPQGEK